MRTTLDIDDDVLAAAKERAAAQNSTAGKVISDLARQALTRRVEVDRLPVRNGFPTLPKRGGIVTPEHIERLAEDEF
jgi:hypothetical protein